MTVSDKVIEILNESQEAKDFRHRFMIELDKHDFTEEERQDKIKFMMMVCIANNQEAMDVMSTSAYEELNK